MSDPGDTPPPSLGIFDRPRRGGITAIEVIALVLSVLWLAAAAIFFLTLPDADGDAPDNLRFVMTMLAIFLPVAMIWVAAMAARASRVMREESQRLQTAIDAMRQTYVTETQARTLATEPTVTRKLDEIAAGQRKTEAALATFSTRRSDQEAPASPEPEQQPDPQDSQPALPIGTPPEALDPPLDHTDLIRALHFPETAEDEEGFAALRRALRHRTVAQLIQAAQDVLTLLSQEGIYMDDLRPDMARPEVWRSFAQGARGKGISSLGGVRDRASLALTAGRMKQDPIFRDAAHHFLRKFDHTFADLEPGFSDSEIRALGETRTARAFMLLGRVAGTFD